MFLPTTHWFISYPAITTYLCWLCQSPLPDKKGYFVCLFTVVFSLTILHGMHLVVPIHPTFFWVVCHPTFFCLTFGPWPTTPVLVGYKLVVLRPCACSTSCVRWKLVCCSCVCHGLKAYLCILLLILDLLWHEVFHDLSFFIGLLLSRVGPYLIVGFSSFSPFFALFVVLLPFLPYHFAILTVVLFDPCLLSLFGPTACSSLNDSMWSLHLFSRYFGLS